MKPAEFKKMFRQLEDTFFNVDVPSAAYKRYLTALKDYDVEAVQEAISGIRGTSTTVNDFPTVERLQNCIPKRFKLQ